MSNPYGLLALQTKCILNIDFRGCKTESECCLAKYTIQHTHHSALPQPTREAKSTIPKSPLLLGLTP